MSIEKIANAIKESSDAKQPVLIAIDGFGGSGKTTIAQKLAVLLDDTFVIGIDDFIVKERLLEISPDEVLFDRNRLTQQILIPLSRGKAAAYQKLEWVNNELSEPFSIPPKKYVIIEGISSSHPEVADYYSYKIWVNTPIEIAKQRGKQRDAGNENEPHWDIWSTNDLAYQSKYHPEKLADYIIDNN